MVVGAVSSRTELAVLGAGPGGYVAALRAADAGLDVTLIERDELGGTCLNVGCIPSKTLIGLANIRYEASQHSFLGISEVAGVDAVALHKEVSGVSTGLRNGVSSLLAAAGVTVVSGEAHFARFDRLSIVQADQVSHLEFDNVIVSTGSRPITLDAFPIGGRIVDSTGALTLDQVPETLAIIGGGYIGVELGIAWAKLGSHVTIIEASEHLLPGIDRQLVQPVERRLTQLGVELRTSSPALKPTDTGVELASGEQVRADVIAVAVGRRPNSDQSGLDTLDLTMTLTGHVSVDVTMRAAPGIYVVGDLVSGPALAHKASAEAEVAVDAILGRPAAFDPAVIPAVVFSDPEIITVGVSIAEAAAAGLNVHRFPHTASARAQTTKSTLGCTVIVSDEHSTIVGVHAVGPHASELAGEAALAIEMAATLDDVALTIHPHPTLSESIVEAAHLARGLPLHMRA